MSQISIITPEKFTAFGELLRYLRRKATLTQRELAIAVGYSESQISRLEHGERSPEESVLAARFVPALYIDDEPDWVARLLELGAETSSRASATDSSQPLSEPKLTPHNLPIQLTSFIGREKEVTEVKRHIINSHLVTLTGPGGCGKTRLAIQVAFDLLDMFPQGIWFVELGSLTNPVFVSHTAATTLGLKEEAGRPFLSILTDHLLKKKILLILDNCEHLVHASAQMAESILHVCPHIHILVTSRELLEVAGEVSFLLPPLSFPDPSSQPTTEDLIKYESARLFVERVAMVSPDFVLNNDNAHAVAQICQRLDGIPLAIELAAARVNLLTVEQIAKRLDDRFHLLTDGSRTLPRHRTLTALIDWSHDLLSDSERILLRRLSVFSGGWTLEAAEAVCADENIQQSDVLELLAQLVNKSLVVAKRKHGMEARYRMLETIREYALEKLKTSGEENTIRKRHGQYYQCMVGDPETEIATFASFMRWEDYVEIEYDNLRAALTWGQSTRGEAELELLLSAELVMFWAYDGRYREEGIGWLKGALAQADREGVETVQLRGPMLGALGLLLELQEQYSEAEAYIIESLNLAREVVDIPHIAGSLLILGSIARERGDNTRARQLLEECLEMFRVLKDNYHIGETLNPLGETLVMQEDSAAATKVLEESLVVFRKLEDLNGIGWALNHLGCTAQLQGEYERATQLHTESLQTFRGFKSHWLGVPRAYSGLGETALAQGKIALAAAHLTNALTLFHELGSRQGISWCLAGLGGASALDEELERAAWLWGAAEALRQLIKSRPAPGVRATHERLQALVRNQLGDNVFNAKWKEGQEASMEQALKEALRF